MLNFNRKVEQSVGLDIGTYSIKVVAVLREANGFILNAYNIKKLPPTSTQNQVEIAVKAALDEIDLHSDDINLSLSGSSVVVRVIDFPKMTREQLSSALGFEAEKYIPFSVNDVVMDFEILGDSSESGKMRVPLATAKSDLVESGIKLTQDLGIIINVLDVDSLAVFNAFTSTHVIEDQGDAFFILDIRRPLF